LVVDDDGLHGNCRLQIADCGLWITRIGGEIVTTLPL
jgi:hypothetical protein